MYHDINNRRAQVYNILNASEKQILNVVLYLFLAVSTKTVRVCSTDLNFGCPRCKTSNLFVKRVHCWLWAYRIFLLEYDYSFFFFFFHCFSHFSSGPVASSVVKAVSIQAWFMSCLLGTKLLGIVQCCG